MEIRESTSSEIIRISDLHKSAFGETDGDTIAKLVIDLFKDHTAQPILSLVGIENETLIGSVLFSGVKIVSSAESVSASILAPMAVLKDHQDRGVGSAIIKHGLETLNQQGANIVFVYGDPTYYTRFGFHTNHMISPPQKLKYPEAWLAMELQQNMLSSVTGSVQCAKTLNDPKHW
jgi:putative acetyltransferase